MEINGKQLANFALNTLPFVCPELSGIGLAAQLFQRLNNANTLCGDLPQMPPTTQSANSSGGYGFGMPQGMPGMAPAGFGGMPGANSQALLGQVGTLLTQVGSLLTQLGQATGAMGGSPMSMAGQLLGQLLGQAGMPGMPQQFGMTQQFGMPQQTPFTQPQFGMPQPSPYGMPQMAMPQPNPFAQPQFGMPQPSPYGMPLMPMPQPSPFMPTPMVNGMPMPQANGPIQMDPDRATRELAKNFDQIRGPSGRVTMQDLQQIASGQKSTTPEMKAAAQFLLQNPQVFAQIETADARNSGRPGFADGQIGKGDINAANAKTGAAVGEAQIKSTLLRYKDDLFSGDGKLSKEELNRVVQDGKMPNGKAAPPDLQAACRDLLARPDLVSKLDVSWQASKGKGNVKEDGIIGKWDLETSVRNDQANNNWSR